MNDITTMKQISELMAEHQNTIMPDDELQWRAWIIPNLENNESAAVLKVHHALGDGIAILVMLGTLVDSYSPAQWI